MGETSLTVPERVLFATGQLLMSLPAPLQRLLSGRRTVRLDGQELAADVQLLLTLMRLEGHKGLDTMTPPAAREDIRRTARLAGAGEPVAAVDDIVVPGPAGDLEARLYRPHQDDRRRPLLIYYHGGGWVVGDLDTHDSVCRFLAHHADVGVLAVNYRLAPEQRFPAAVDDAFATFCFAAARAEELGFDPARLAVAGDSAGGNLSAVVSQLASRGGGVVPAAQLLIYPCTDLSTKHASFRLFSEGFFLTEAEMDWYRGHYLPDEAAAHDPRASPLLAAELASLPPTIVLTAGFDVLRDEAEAYAHRLENAGVPVTLRRFDGLIHGFANATGISRSARQAMAQAARDLADRLGT